MIPPLKIVYLLQLILTQEVTMAIKKLWIDEGCIADGICMEICPDVFEEDENGEAFVKEGADLNANEACIKEAADECPAEVIRYEED